MSKYPIFNSIAGFSEHLGMERFSPECVKAGDWSRFPRLGRDSRDTGCAVTEFSSGWFYGSNCETGARALYTATGRHHLNDGERAALRVWMAREVRESSKKRKEMFKQSQEMCATFFASGITSRLMAYDAPNPYLVRQGLGAVNAKLWTCTAKDVSRFMAIWLRRPSYSLTALDGKPLQGPCLVVPIGRHPNVCNIQLIDADGRKTFLSGAVMNGRYWHAHDETVYQAARRIAIVEDVATALSVNRAYGCPVVAAMDGGNLKAVYERLKRDYPSSEIIFISDKDAGRITEPTWTAEDEARYPVLKDVKAADFDEYLMTAQCMAPRQAMAGSVGRNL